MPTLFRSLWDEAAVPDPPRRTWWDWALVAATVFVAVLEAAVRPGLLFSATVVVALAPTLLWRRTRPLLMVAIAFLGSAVATLVAGEQVGPVAAVCFLVLPYALYRWGSGRDAVAGTAIILANIGVSIAVAGVAVADAVGSVAVLSAAMALGAATRFRARARARELDQVRLRERERLARDLHDTVAHHVSAMAVRAQAGLAASAARPDAATDALRVIEHEASRTLREMRAMVRVLREDDAVEIAPAPTVADLDELSTEGQRGGPTVDVVVADEAADLPTAVGAAVYRLAREAVTNALRHARNATCVQVTVTADATSVKLRVSDDGDPVPPRQRWVAGYGIPGMVERAALLGGTCEAGPAPDRGWLVTAVLPHGGITG